MTREFFSAYPRVGPAHPARGSFSLAQRLLSYQYSIILLWYHIQTMKHLQIQIRILASIHIHYIHPHPLLQPSQISLRGTKNTIIFFVKCGPTGQIRGSNLRVKINGLGGQGDPTCMKPVSHGSIGRWQAGSGRVRRL